MDLGRGSSIEARDIVDSKCCIYSNCSHAGRVITKDDGGVRVTVPSKRLRKMKKALKETLTIEWDETKEAMFHKDCWDVILKVLDTKPASKAPKGVIAAADFTLLDEIRDTAELFEPISELKRKAAEIASLMRKSKHTTVFTGAGISVAAGLPTYRGVDGIDVIDMYGGKVEAAAAEAASASVAAPEADEGGAKKRSKKVKKTAKSDEDLYMESSQEYLRLKPTLTHRIISKWVNETNMVHYVITQNCDDLHYRSGIPTDRLAELHGNVFVEYCEACGAEHRRKYCVDIFSTDCSKEKWYVECGSCHFNHYTGRTCEKPACGGKLRDTIVNFGDPLHELGPLGGLQRATQECRMSSVVLCLGCSMTVTPACELPTLMKQGSLVIVNLQATDFDDQCAVRGWGHADQLLYFIDQALAAPGVAD